MTQAKPLCGFLNVLKPPGMSSAQVVGCVRRLLGGVEAGHAGTLDPEAAGVLPVMVGKAARLFDYLQDKEKEYVAEVAFGVATDTQDAQGVPIAHGDRWPDEAAIAAALPRFKGKILRTPPMYSALKQDGQRLYDLARSWPGGQRPRQRSHGVCAGPYGAYTRTWGAFARSLLRGDSMCVPCATIWARRWAVPRICAFCCAHAAALSGWIRPLRWRRSQKRPPRERWPGAGSLPETGLGAMAMAQVPPDLEKAVRNGGHVPWNRFAAQGVSAGAAFWTAAGGGAAGRGAATGRRGQGENLACGMSR